MKPPTAKSKERIEGAIRFYEGDLRENAFEELIHTVFSIGWAQGYDDTQFMLREAAKALRSGRSQP